MAALRARAHGAVARHSLRGASIGVGSSTIPEYVIDPPLAIESIDEGGFNKQEIKKLPVRYEMTISGNIDAAALPAILLALGEINGCTTIFRTPCRPSRREGFSYGCLRTTAPHAPLGLLPASCRGASIHDGTKCRF